MKKILTAIAACGIFAVSLHHSSATPTMRLSVDGGASWVIVVDNGPLDSDPTVGNIGYNGPIGDWSVSTAAGFGYGGPTVPTMDITSRNQSLQAESLIVQLSDTDFAPFPNETFVAQFGVITDGTATYNSYRDPGNVLFGTTKTYTGGPLGSSPSPTAALLMTEGPFINTTTTASNAVVVAAGGSSPYSLTLETVIVHTAAGYSGTDALLFTLPPPTCTGKIGDLVWNDLNANGCQDAGEPGIPGVKVDLYAGCGATKGSLLKSTTTDSNGNYVFDGLCAGNYTVSFTTPNGFVHTVAHQGCGDTSGDVLHNPLDSNCECAGADNCDVCVTLPADDSVDLTIDCGYIGAAPCLTLAKTADADTALAGGQMGYTYTVTNCGGTTFTNLAIIDDAGTPNFLGDDFSVATNLTLAPGQGTNFHVTVALPVLECVSNSNPSLPAGTLVVQTLASGDIQVTFRQSRTLNDNVYGTPAVADGWSGGHKFGDLTGSDKAEFRFTDSTGKVVLDFFIDYISAASSSVTPMGTISYPSGYGSLGPNGGDGSMVTGSKSNVLWWSSTLTENLNSGLNGGFPSPYTVNSPTPESSFPNWDYVDGYTVIVSKNAFAAGFGGVTIPYVHNSPAKTGNNQVSPVPCSGCITNTASVVIVTNGNVLAATLDTDDAVVCVGTPTPPAPPCIITKGAFKIDKNTIQLPLKNAGTANIVLSEVDLGWNQAVNGRIVKMSLNGDFYTSPSLSSPIALTSGFVSDANKRTIAKGATKTLVITFEHPASKVLTDYTGGTVKFGSACVVTFP